jgi:hypothetical protein
MSHGAPLRSVTLRLTEDILEVYTRAARAMGVDRTELFRQVLVGGLPAMKATVAALEAINAGQQVEGLAIWRKLLGNVAVQGGDMVADLEQLEAVERGKLSSVEVGASPASTRARPTARGIAVKAG